MADTKRETPADHRRGRRGRRGGRGSCRKDRDRFGKQRNGVAGAGERLLPDAPARGRAPVRRDVRGACAPLAVGAARSDNTKANNTKPKQPVTLANDPAYDATFQQTYKPRITGNFTGTTDEIFQWATCKWGISDNMIRAQAVQESHWHQNTESDKEPRSAGFCAPGDDRDPCPTSFGILQIKWCFHPGKSAMGSSYPMSKTMTAFSVDYEVAEMRVLRRPFVRRRQGQGRPLRMHGPLVRRRLAQPRGRPVHLRGERPPCRQALARLARLDDVVDRPGRRRNYF